MASRVIKSLTIAYLILMIVDGILSMVDSVGPDRSLSTATSTALLPLSVLAFALGVVLVIKGMLRPQWPLLVASGFLLFSVGALVGGVLLSGTIGGALLWDESDSSRATLRLLNAVGGASELIVGGICLAGLLRYRATPGDGLKGGLG
jgi:hypothetical protein